MDVACTCFLSPLLICFKIRHSVRTYCMTLFAPPFKDVDLYVFFIKKKKRNFRPKSNTRQFQWRWVILPLRLCPTPALESFKHMHLYNYTKGLCLIIIFWSLPNSTETSLSHHLWKQLMIIRNKALKYNIRALSKHFYISNAPATHLRVISII